MKLDNTDATSIEFFYDNIPYDKEQFYEYSKWSSNSGNNHGDFEIPYSLYSSNDYKISSCKITFKIIDIQDTTKEIEEIDKTEAVEEICTNESIEKIDTTEAINTTKLTEST